MNRLINEKSPYLLQHANNPVDWYPWCEEAFKKAKALDVPVFLSIGYSTCHWCHVMAGESFEDSQVAQILNDGFVSIKVDKEERPDIDSVYMSACQAMTGSGGWPLTIIMTADKRPFFAGTYFPKKSNHNMIGLIPLLNTVREKWETEREALIEQGERLTDFLSADSSLSQTSSPHASPDMMIGRAIDYFKKSFDRIYGGFGRSPKFPAPHNLLFLMEQDDPKCLDMAETTLIQMYRGGLYDHTSRYLNNVFCGIFYAFYC